MTISFHELISFLPYGGVLLGVVMLVTTLLVGKPASQNADSPVIVPSPESAVARVSAERDSILRQIVPILDTSNAFPVSLPWPRRSDVTLDPYYCRAAVEAAATSLREKGWTVELHSGHSWQPGPVLDFWTMGFFHTREGSEADTALVINVPHSAAAAMSG